MNSARIEKDGQGFHEFKKKSNYRSFHNTFSTYVRSFGDVYYWPKGKFHVVTRAKLAKEALMNPSISCDRSPFFISRMPNMDLSLIQDFFGVVSKMMVMRDGKDHKQRRSIATFGLNDQLIDNYVQRIPAIINDFLKNKELGGQIDFVRDISSKLPSVILADLFDVPKEDRDDFYKYSNIMTGFFGGGTGYENEDGVKVNQAAIELREYFKNLINKRKGDPKEDFFSGMLKVASQFDLDEADLISQAIMMLVAGQVTTTDQMNNIMFQLLEERELLEQVKENPSLVPKMIEEFKRMDPAVTFIFRVAKDDTNIGDQIINKGETIFISTHCINRDEDIFEKPNEINFLRKNLNHFSYGYGAHYCLGARLAKIEMNKLFTLMINRFPNMKLGNEPIERDHYSLSFSGFKNLPIILNS